VGKPEEEQEEQGGGAGGGPSTHNVGAGHIHMDPDIPSLSLGNKRGLGNQKTKQNNNNKKKKTSGCQSDETEK